MRYLSRPSFMPLAPAVLVSLRLPAVLVSLRLAVASAVMALPEKRQRCALVPERTHPRSDLATPKDKLVTVTAANRLRKRRSRSESAGRPTTCPFPWNPASRALVAGANYHVEKK